MNTYVFYANQLLIQFDDPLDFKIWRKSVVVGCPEFYNGAYVYQPDVYKSGWGHMDMTPCLLDEVPKETQLLALLCAGT